MAAGELTPSPNQYKLIDPKKYKEKSGQSAAV
jgi:hypothetical protein